MTTKILQLGNKMEALKYLIIENVNTIIYNMNI